MNEFLEQFLVESRELTELATRELLALEQAPGNRELLDGAFRAMHTLKGGAGIVDFMAMSRAVHAAEGALSSVRSGHHDITADLMGDCLSCVDQVVQWLDTIEATGTLPLSPDAAADAIVARFGYIADPTRLDEAREAEDADAGEDPARLSLAARRILNEQILLLAEAVPSGREGRTASSARVAGNVLRHAGDEPGALAVDRAMEEILRGGDVQILVHAILQSLNGPQVAEEHGAPALARTESAARTLRVDAERVNALVNITGELVVAKNAIAHIARLAEDGGNTLSPLLRTEYARLQRLTDNLQHAVLSLRVLPLRAVFQRFSRVVREMAVALEKPANLVIEGEDTEADKAIVEMLFEPLLHIVRNTMDHGLEPASERLAAGKPEIATIALHAQRQGEHVTVEVVDDGRGIDVARIRKVARERGLAPDDVLSSLSDDDVIDLIFAPGFSTAKEVTGVSGRGVGMDAVRRAVERIGGRVSVESKPRQGTTVRLVLPFSVMMTRVMTVQAAGQTFGIPLDAVIETVRIPRDRVQAIGSAGAFVLRDRTVPLIDLAATLGQSRPRRDASEVIAVVASISGQFSALEVDRIGERMDVMLKPMEGLIAGAPGIAGTTLLGDGQVLLILDLQDLLA